MFMKILTGNRIKEADRYTIEKEPICSIDLMERASQAIALWFIQHVDKKSSLLFLIGKGNNGGDGLAVARLLCKEGFNCSVYLLFEKKEITLECSTNLQRLPKEVNLCSNLENISRDTLLVDALLGSGVKGEIREPLLSLIKLINSIPNKVISIDLPSGMKTEFENSQQVIIQADITLALEFPKLAMLLPEAGNYCGTIEIISIGLSKEYILNTSVSYYYLTKEYIQTRKQHRTKFAHKGTYGHALLIVGSQGMIGAALLATEGALRSGCGLVTTHLPKGERVALQVGCPSAMLSLDNQTYFSEPPSNLSKFTAIGIGPGLGQASSSINAFKLLLQSVKCPLVIDADALNILATNNELLSHLPECSILTPHPGELKRLLGDWQSEEEKILKVQAFAKKHKVVILVKGSHTMICNSDGDCYFNSTGNSGMAKGGSGDILSGYICGLLARGYNCKDAAILGVYLHGLAGDRAALKYGKEAMNSKDILDGFYD